MVFKRAFLITILLMVSTLVLFNTSFAADEEKIPETRPERLVTVAAEYPGVRIAKGGDKVEINIFFRNKGKTDENLNLKIVNKYKNWKTSITNLTYSITGVFVPSGNQKSLTFQAEADKDVQPGKYEFFINAQTDDGKLKMSEKVLVEVMKQKSELDAARGIKLTSSYPEIKGAPDATFKFTLELNSTIKDDILADLVAKGPEGWDINFKPEYEDKYISSLLIKVNEYRKINVEVKPPADARAGTYPIDIKISTPKDKLETTLTVILTGTYGLDVKTAGGLLSLDARQAKPSNISFYIKNTGSATNNNIKFTTFKPENWKVEFKPEKIDTIEPGDLKQVEMIITPYADALVGDYSVAVDVAGEKVAKNIELRVTVKASAAWGWIGIGIIVLVIAGLFGLFRRFGRR